MRRTVRELFSLSNWALVEAWQSAKLQDVQLRFAPKRENPAGPASAELDAMTESRSAEERKIAIETIRLVISFRLMNGDADKLAKVEEEDASATD